MVLAVAGTTNTYVIEENGACIVSETLTTGKMTIFPRGSLHSTQNTDRLSLPRIVYSSILTCEPDCRNATLIPALNSEDSGTYNILNGLFTLPFDIIQAAYGNPVMTPPHMSS